MRILCVGAHEDDESFGALGTLLKHKEAGDTFYFVWFTDGRQTTGEYPVAEYFGASYTQQHLPDQKLDTFPLVDLIKPIEEVVKSFKPDIAYIPFIHDLNKDHRLVSEATMVACRPYKETAPKKVYMYQIPGSTELGLHPFKATKKEKIDQQKKEALIRQWYPGELVNGRGVLKDTEEFQSWPV